MKSYLVFLLSCLFLLPVVRGDDSKPLRIFIRAGEKTHGPGQHDGPTFLKDWTKLLTERGAKVAGKIGFPTGAELEATDVMVMYAAEAGTIAAGDRTNLDAFLKRGGGLVVIHDSVCGNDAQWWKTVIGGAWEHGHSKWYEGDVSMYFTDYKHELTEGVSNWDFDDEIYYDLHMMPEAKVLASSYAPDKRNTKEGRILPSVYDVVPQMWVYEKDAYRAFVSIPGHNTKSFALPHFRGLLLRGIAWSGHRPMDSLCSKEELNSFRYPEGGPSRPEAALAQIKTWPDFETSLVAAEPLVQKPISVDWDADGRLWVAETVEYPAKKDPNAPGRDRISILEDSNGDGVMDKKTVWYEGLSLVTSFVFYKDGVIVSQAPDVLWIRDTNGDGKADKVEKVYTGFGVFDTHAVINNLRWGLDGWIYATVGYSRGDVSSGDGSKHFGKISDGVIRFKADGSAIEQFSSKGSNTWGVDVAPDGEVFFSQANGNHINHVVVPENILAKGKLPNTVSYKTIEDHNKAFPIRDYKQQAYVQIDWVGNWTAAAGACIYNGGAWPAKYDYTYTVTEPTLNIVHLDVIKPAGPTYVASRMEGFPESEFVASTDLWFRPIHTRIGPDGGFYILDFYNQAAVHNDTRGPKHGPNNAAVRPDRDHYFGRIWKVQHKQAVKLQVPRLSKTTTEQLVASLKHPSGVVRFNAQRLLIERGNTDVIPQVKAVATATDSGVYPRLNAAWTADALGKEHDAEMLAALFKSDAPALRRTAMQILRNTPLPPEMTAEQLQVWGPLLMDMGGALSTADDRTRLEILMAYAASDTKWFETEESAPVRKFLLEAYSGLKDGWSQSAMLAYYKKASQQYITSAIELGSPDLTVPVTELTKGIAGSDNAADAAALVISVAKQSGPNDALKAVVLSTLSTSLKPSLIPSWSEDLQKALTSLLASPSPSLPGSVLPLIARWDTEGRLKSATASQVKQLIARLADTTLAEEQRVQVVGSLIGVRQLNSGILPAIAAVATSDATPTLKKKVIDLLGASGDATVGPLLAKAYPNLTGEAQDAAFTQLLKRADWTSGFLDALSAKTIPFASLSPVALGRLRSHADKAVSDKAIALIEELRGPQLKEKNAIIAKFTPEVEKPGNAVHGRELFTQNCAICHIINGQGRNLAPDLTGMGVHGAAELLIHILDPNRVVEPNFMAVSFETKDGESYDGIVGRENRETVLLRNAAGDTELKVSNIQSRKNTGRSLMPEGFEALGAENLRDLLSYVTEGQNLYRIMDVQSAFTADSRGGIYSSITPEGGSIRLKSFGLIKAGAVPFEVANPTKTANGKNLIVLKGGENFARTLPQSVEFPGHGVKASRLHFLGGVGGWGYPCCGDDDHKNLNAAKITVHYADQQSEEIVLKNGVEIADYIGDFDVPGSKKLEGVVTSGQMRWFSKDLKRYEPISRVTIESYNNFVVPTFVAITAETSAPGTAPQASAAPAPKSDARTLIVGGGSSHDFARWFNEADVATLKAAGIVADYTSDTSTVKDRLKDIDVLYLSNNQPFADAETRNAIMAFADSGKGLMLIHPALWYNWANWKEYNTKLIGGGSHGHDKFGEFEVTVDATDHPIMKGVPKGFKITDELYHHEKEPDGATITVLATGRNAAGESWPVVWITKHDKARIVCVTLGHDGQAHNHPAYQKLLVNIQQYVAGKSK